MHRYSIRIADDQVSLLITMLRHLYPGIEIGTVDGMQGREKDCVILSLVRSNDLREVGFLADFRRMNGMLCKSKNSVAITRARRHLMIVGDGETVGSGGGSFLKSLVGYLEENAEVRFPSETV